MFVTMRATRFPCPNAVASGKQELLLSLLRALQVFGGHFSQVIRASIPFAGDCGSKASRMKRCIENRIETDVQVKHDIEKTLKQIVIGH